MLQGLTSTGAGIKQRLVQRQVWDVLLQAAVDIGVVRSLAHIHPSGGVPDIRA